MFMCKGCKGCVWNTDCNGKDFNTKGMRCSFYDNDDLEYKWSEMTHNKYLKNKKKNEEDDMLDIFTPSEMEAWYSVCSKLD